MMKKLIKEVIGRSLTVFNYPILVNSYGRSGSTVLTKSIVKCAERIKSVSEIELVERSMLQSAWDLENASLKNGIVYKTHDYPPGREFPQGTRMLYTYADPVDVVLSLLRLHDERGEWWMKKHLAHLKAPYPDSFEDIIDGDLLRLEHHMDCWLQEKRFPIAFIRYESMWKYQKNISDFLGFAIQLPPFQERKAVKQNDKELVAKLKSTYKDLRTKIEQLPPFFIRNINDVA